MGFIFSRLFNWFRCMTTLIKPIYTDAICSFGSLHLEPYLEMRISRESGGISHWECKGPE